MGIPVSIFFLWESFGHCNSVVRNGNRNHHSGMEIINPIPSTSIYLRAGVMRAGQEVHDEAGEDDE